MLPALIGISGHEVGAEEEAAIRRWEPAGFFLLSRYNDSVELVRGLTESLRKHCLSLPWTRRGAVWCALLPWA